MEEQRLYSSWIAELVTLSQGSVTRSSRAACGSYAPPWWLPQADLEMEMADIADKELWVSKFTAMLCQKAYGAQSHKRSEIKRRPTE